MYNQYKLTGKKFGRWIVGEYVGKSKWHCKCECGVEKDVYTGFLINGRSKSCGCLRTEMVVKRHFKHGMSRTKPHMIWTNMINRCERESVDSYPIYGGRGIKVCKRWHEFRYFWMDMGFGYKEGLLLDRIDPNGDYRPNNCRWVTPLKQANNKRDTIYLTYKGERKPISDWAREMGVKRSTLATRKYKGWSDEEILKTPIRKDPRKNKSTKSKIGRLLKAYKRD